MSNVTLGIRLPKSVPGGQPSRCGALGRQPDKHGWFTEGFDTPELKDAKALLNELVGREQRVSL
jgi:hypothetical protein